MYCHLLLQDKNPHKRTGVTCLCLTSHVFGMSIDPALTVQALRPSRSVITRVTSAPARMYLETICPLLQIPPSGMAMLCLIHSRNPLQMLIFPVCRQDMTLRCTDNTPLWLPSLLIIMQTYKVDCLMRLRRRRWSSGKQESQALMDMSTHQLHL